MKRKNCIIILREFLQSSNFLSFSNFYNSYSQKITLFFVILQISKINPYFAPWEFFLKELHLFYTLAQRISRTFLAMQSEIVSYVLNVYSQSYPQVEPPAWFFPFCLWTMQGKRIIFCLIFHVMNTFCTCNENNCWEILHNSKIN